MESPASTTASCVEYLSALGVLLRLKSSKSSARLFPCTPCLSTHIPNFLLRPQNASQDPLIRLGYVTLEWRVDAFPRMSWLDHEWEIPDLKSSLVIITLANNLSSSDYIHFNRISGKIYQEPNFLVCSLIFNSPDLISSWTCTYPCVGGGFWRGRVCVR